jgi:hypothetical protein
LKKIFIQQRFVAAVRIKRVDLVSLQVEDDLFEYLPGHRPGVLLVPGPLIGAKPAFPVAQRGRFDLDVQGISADDRLVLFKGRFQSVMIAAPGN